MRSWAAKVALVAAMCVLVAAVAIGFESSRGAAGGAPAGAPKISAAAARALLAGSPPPLATLHRQAGELLARGGLTARLRALRGHPVVLNVWASWCPPCREEMPWMAAASARFGGRVAFLGADLEDDGPGARRLLARAAVHYPSYAAARGEIDALAPLHGTPGTLIFDREGELAGEKIGAFGSYDELAAFAAPRRANLVAVSGPRPTAEADRYAHRFGSSPPLSLGVEEELLLVDAELALATCAEAVMEGVPGAAAGRVSTRLQRTDRGQDRRLPRRRGGAGAAARDPREVASAGFRMLGSGLHPAATGRVRLVSNPRYQVVKEDLGEIILSSPPCGLHVHVGIPDPEAAVRIANAFRRYLPVLGALSANSPFRRGADSGHASARTTVVRAYPRFQVPRAFRDYEDFCRVADELIAAAGVDDYTYIWWDVRPHPKLGTVEVRALDVQADAATSVALAALIQAIAARELERPSGAGHAREALEESYFQAASHGLAARILLDDDSPEPAPQVARQVLDAARPYARELGADAALEELERVLREGNGADEQRRVHAAGGMRGLLVDSSPAPADARHGARRGRRRNPDCNAGHPLPAARRVA